MKADNYEIKYLTFFKDWHEYAKKYKLTKEQYGEVIFAMCEYCFFGVDTELKGIEGMMYDLSKKNIDASSKRKITGHYGGSKGGGGAPIGNKNAQKKDKE